MASSQKGKFLLLLLLLVLDGGFTIIYTVHADSETETVVTETQHLSSLDTNGLDVLNRHQVQLLKLEELVKNLSELVVKLESRFSDCQNVKSLDDRKQNNEGTPRFAFQEKVEFGKREGETDGVVEKIGYGGLETKAREGERVGAVSVTKYSPFWSERFQFVSAMKFGSNATCINVLPFKDFEGLSKYVTIGDDKGRIYVFLRNGDVLIEFYTLSESPVTAMVSYFSVYKNESILVTGHENGMILMHRVWEVSNGDQEYSSLHMETVGKFTSPDVGEVGPPITLLEVHHVGRKKYLLSADLSGKIRVFSENGAVYGLVTPTSRPLVFLKQRLLFLTETGAGSIDLRTMKIRESECEGLNNSVAKIYVFDATERSKAYGFTSEGELIHVLLIGDMMNFKCRVRSKRKFDMDEPLAFQAIKGYLLVANQEKVSVFNVSSQQYVRAGGPRLLFSAGLDEIIASFLNYQPRYVNDEKKTVIPLVASDREKLVILSLGSGYVGIYRSNLPVFKNEFNTILWTSPVLFFIIFLFGAWHFFANKKEALTSWGPDDPFTSTSLTNGAPLGTGAGERTFTDSSRNADMMDVRSSALRPPRRYGSPSRYPGGSANSYMPSSTETNSRPASVDPSFRPTSELKYRGSNLDTSGFPKRREGMFVNNQVVDDSN